MKFALCTLFALAVGLTACGGNEPPPQNAAGKEHAEHGEHAGPAGQHEEMKGPVGEFHAVLSPVYHAPKGDERTKQVCQQAQAMHDRAAAVESGAVPEGAKAEDYKAAGKNLTATVDRLAEACKAATSAVVDPALEEVHDAFHKLIEVPGVMPARHDEHGEHGDHH